MNVNIPLYVINLKHRTDRLKHILSEFRNRQEFELHIIQAEESEIGAVGLWESIVKVVRLAEKKDEDVIVICEDDHKFTDSYSAEYFIDTVFLAHHLQTKLLIGGISGGNTLSAFVNENLLWIDRFWGTQFIVIY